MSASSQASLSPFAAIVNLVLAAYAVIGLGCTSNPAIGAFQKEIRDQGFSAFNQPIGDPHNLNDWNKFGPGAVLRSKMQTYYYSAKTLIGDQGVRDAMNPQKCLTHQPL